MGTQQRVIQSQQHNQDIAHKILLSIKDIRFGSMEVVIHSSKMLRSKRKEKILFDTHRYDRLSDGPMTSQRCCPI
jgi:hypothetical protein